jgi:hypothetical protein
LLILSREFFVREALAHDLADQITEAVPITHRQAIVEPKRLFVNVTEQWNGSTLT